MRLLAIPFIYHAHLQSDCFYNAGWTEDIRVVLHYLHKEYPKAPLFVVGTSIGANILVGFNLSPRISLYWLYPRPDCKIDDKLMVTMC